MEDAVKPWILDKIAQGKAILFLGAGAAFGARGDNGELPLSGDALRDHLSECFLGGEEKTKTLVQVADYAKHEAGLLEVQQVIKKKFHPLKPADFHKIIPTFRWHSIFTTNYDLVIERAYADTANRLQNISPIIRDGDNFSEVMRDITSVPYFKLHGCINAVSDTHLPLILASEEYAKHKKGRIRLFRHLAEFGLEHPIIFCGYQLNDPNIQQILFDLSDMGLNRPTYLLVDPGLGKYDMKMWAAQRIEPIKATLEEFLRFIDARLDRRLRVLAQITSQHTNPIDRHLKAGASLSDSLISYLGTELQHVFPDMKSSGVKPADFYKGLDPEWGGIRQELDIKRRVSDQIVIDAVIEPSLVGLKTFLLKGYAGSGKTTVLKRVGWYAANNLSATVVRLRDGAVLRPALIKELALKCDKRLILIVDDAVSNAEDMLKLYRAFEYEPAEISILTSARNNEWNQFGEELDRYINSEYELSTLSEKEIDELIAKLRHHNCLGNFKTTLEDDIRKYFSLSADRQLLVALHEVTSGKPFEEIVLNEYAKISPQEAKILYMDVCTLNRLDIPVRAGLISRISGIGIEDFRLRFLSPLEHVVRVVMDYASRDYVYTARHSLIAKFVFEHALKTAEEKAAQVVRVLEHLNLEYVADSDAFDHLIRGKQLADIFGDKALVAKIYEAAEKTGADRHYILHQRAVFELSHPGCDTRAALNFILQAENALPEGRSDKSIAHTKATVFKRLARESKNSLEIGKFRAEAKLILERLMPGQKDSRAVNGLAELQLDELDSELHQLSQLDSDDLMKRAFLEQVKQAENTIYTGLQKFPGDEYLLTRQQDLARKLQDNETAHKILEEAYSKNRTSEFISIRLARHRSTSGDYEAAQKILRDCLALNPNSKPLHLELSKLLIGLNATHHNAEIEHHLKRSFSPSDSNFDAQFWYARHHYLYGDRSKSREIFSYLKKARMPPKQKNALTGFSVDAEGKQMVYRGSIAVEHVSFCFIRCPELNDNIFAHVDRFNNLPAEGLRSNVDVTFKLAFTMKGPAASSVDICF